MKIKEAVDIINGTLTAKAMYNEHSIFMCYKHLPFDNHCFLTLRADTRSWGGVTLVSSAIDGVIPQDLARVMDVVQRLIDTPVKERFPERKYRLRWIDSKLSGLNSFLCYLFISSNCWDMADNYLCGKAIFTESELNKLKKDNPRLAPAIDALKEEVDNNEN